MEKDEDYWNTSTTKAFSFDESDDLMPSTSRFERSSLIADDNVSEISTDSISTVRSEEFELSQMISDEDLKILIEEQSSDPEPVRKGIPVEEELRFLRRKLQETIHPPPAESTALQLLRGKACSLEPYKALEDKIALLDAVIATSNGSAILGVTLFLQRTLNKKNFNQILMSHSDAAEQYINYLETKMQIHEASDILTMLGRDMDAAIMQFKVATQMYPDPQVQRQKLKRVYSDYFAQPGADPQQAKFVSNALNLLEWQLLEKSTGAPDELVGASPAETLYYCCSKHNWNEPNSNAHTNPYKFMKDFNISRTMFEWVALSERAEAKAYPDLDKIFEKPSWTSLITGPFQITVPLDVVIERLNELEAPAQVLQSFLAKMSNASERLELAKDIKCAKGVIDALVALKDKEQLQEYVNTLAEGCEERFYGENALKTMGKKWPIDNLPLLRK